MILLPDMTHLQDIFEQFPDVLAVYAFGSYVTGKTHPESDLDMAIVPRSSSARKQRLDMLTALARQGFCHVDLVFLDTPDIVIKFEAVRHNRVVYQTDDFEPGVFYSKILRQYFDFLPYLHVQREAYKRRILNGER